VHLSHSLNMSLASAPGPCSLFFGWAGTALMVVLASERRPSPQWPPFAPHRSETTAAALLNDCDALVDWLRARGIAAGRGSIAGTLEAVSKFSYRPARTPIPHGLP
jgi:hypothetical protein